MAPIATSPTREHLSSTFAKTSLKSSHRSIIDELSVEEKVFLLSGRSFFDTPEVTRLGIPSLKTSDGPSGCRGALSEDGPPSAAFPNASCLGSTFDSALLEQVGREIGKEAVLKSANLMGGPTINLHRNPLGGRNFECYSEDPVLTGIMGTAWVKGLQEVGVGANIKHLVCNDRETHRKTYDVRVSMKALREVYLRPFEMIIKDANPVSIMAAYNDLNGTPCSQDEEVLRIVREEFGHDGLIMSDWFGTKDGAKSLMAGVDLEMPFPVMRGSKLLAKVKSGEVPMHFVDTAVRRMIEAGKRTNAPMNRLPERPFDGDKERIAICRKAAAAGAVLLRNEHDVLPLATGSNVLVIGELAVQPSYCGGGSALLYAPYVSAPLDAIRDANGGSVTYHCGVPTWRLVPELGARYSNGIKTTMRNAGNDDIVAVDQRPNACISLLDGRPEGLGENFNLTTETVLSVPVSGRYILSIFCVAQAEVYLGDKLLQTIHPAHISTEAFLFERFNFETRICIDLAADTPVALRIVSQSKEKTGYEPAPQGLRVGLELDVDTDRALAEIEELATKADRVVLMSGLVPDWESEGSDRVDMRLPGRQEELVKMLARIAGDKVVMVNQSGTPVDLRCADGIAGIVQAFYGGMECGNAIADLLFGRTNPSGRLSMTFPTTIEQCPTTESFASDEGGLKYVEESHFGYRSYERDGLVPAYPFGFGLSYTSFDWTEPKIASNAESHDISLRVVNTGSVAGQDVVQIFVSKGEAEPRKLEAFAKTELVRPGESELVRVRLDRRAFERWDEGSGAWTVESGSWRVGLCKNALEEVTGFDVVL